MLFTALTLLGVISYNQLAIEIIPDADLPMLFVQANGQTEADPSYVESQLIIPLEGAIGTLEGIEKIEFFFQFCKSYHIQFKPGKVQDVLFYTFSKFFKII